jgi:hypothetical protein
LNTNIVKPNHVEERVQPPQSPVGLSANSAAVAKAAGDVAASITYSHPPLRPASSPSPVPSTDPPRQRTTKRKAASSRLRKPQPAKKKTAPAAPTTRADQSDDDELALIVASPPVPVAPTQKPKHATTTKPGPTKRQRSAKPVDAESMEVQLTAKKTTRAKPSRAPLNQTGAELPSLNELSAGPSPSALGPPRPKKKEPKSVRLV